MTSLGKAFVLAVTTLSMMLLSFSIAAVATATPWKDVVKARNDKSQKAQQDFNDVDQRVKAEQGLVAAAQARNDDITKRYGADVADLAKKTEDSGKEIVAHRQSLGQIRTRAAETLAETQGLAGQVEAARADRDALQAQIDAFGQQNEELDAQIAVIERELATANKHQADRRSPAALAAPSGRR